MTYIEENVNQYGTPVSVFRCDDCSDVFTVCPAVPEERRDEWQKCLAATCSSYEADRDVDFLVGAVETEPVGVKERRDAWAAVNAALDSAGGSDSCQYRDAWARWEQLSLGGSE